MSAIKIYELFSSLEFDRVDALFKESSLSSSDLLKRFKKTNKRKPNRFEQPEFSHHQKNFIFGSIIAIFKPNP
jgi:hypothetical protein